VFDVVAETMPCPSAPTVSRLRWSTPAARAALVNSEKLS